MNKFVAMLLIAVLALGGSAFHFWRQRAADHERIATLQASLANAMADARVTASSPALEGPVTGAGSPTTRTGEVAASLIPEVASEARANAAAARAGLASPENLERARVLDRARVPIQYPDMGQALGLSPEEEGRLHDLLAQQQTNALQHLAAYPVSGETRSQFAARVVRENEAEIASMLGSKYSQWKEYKDELLSRNQVKDLGAVLRPSGMPLSDTQAEALIPVLVSARKRSYQLGGPIYSPANTQALVDAAANYLSPAQLDAYRQMVDRQQGVGVRPSFGRAPPVSGATATPATN